MWPAHPENYAIEKLSKISFKIDQYNSDKIQLLGQLAEKFNFQIWEFRRNDDFISGQLVFTSFLEAYKFLRKHANSPDIQFTNSWYENIQDDIASSLLNEMNEKLNYDCIEKIADNLNVLGMADLIGSNGQLGTIARRRFGNLVINESTVGSKFGIMHFCYVLQSFGQFIENIDVSIRCLRGNHRNPHNFELKYGILHCIVNFSGPLLNSVRLNHFSFSQYEIDHIQPLLLMLNNRNVIINMT